MFKRIVTKEDGTEVVQFALLAPLLIFITFGFLIMGFGLYAKIIVSDAAREGARYQALGLGNAEVKVEEIVKGSGLNIGQVYINDNSTPRNSSNALFIDKKNSTSGGYPFTDLKVTYGMPSMIPGLPKLVGGEEWDVFTITSISSFKRER
jgi:hypothetical protein